MRIIGGSHRGLKLNSPPSDAIRPTTDRMRETLFNMLEHGTGPGIRNLTVLDLFSGAGTLGIEAISRGAKSVTFVDRNLEHTRQNYTKLKNAPQAKFLMLDARSINSSVGTFDIIFMDPPYRKNMVIPTLQNLLDQEMINKDGIVIVEYSSDEVIEWPTGFQEIKQKKIGDAVFSILELNS